MYSVITLLCCLALFCRIPVLADDARLRIRSPRLLDFADSGISSTNEIENIPALDYSPPPPPLYSEYEPLGSEQEKDIETTLPNDSIDNTIRPAAEDASNEGTTWAVLDGNKDPKISGAANVNVTAPTALTNSAFSQHIAPTSTSLDPSTAYGVAPSLSSSATPLSASSISQVLATPSVLSSQDVKASSTVSSQSAVVSPTVSSQVSLVSTTSLASPSLAGEPKTNATFIGSLGPSSTESASVSTSVFSTYSSSAFDVKPSSTSGVAVIGTGQVSATHALPGTATSDTPNIGTTTKLYNSTSTSIELAPVTETSSAHYTFTTSSLIDSTTTPYEFASSTQASATFSSSSLSNSSATQTLATTSSFQATTSSALETTSTALASTTLEPLPLPANSSTVYTDTKTFTTSGTAVYTSFTQSSTSIPITSNDTSTSSSFTTITVPQLTTSYSPPEQTSSSSSNSSYTTPSNNATSYSPLPSSTKTYTPTTVLTSALTIIMPTATNTASTFIPSSIIAQTSSTYTTGQSSTKSTGIPSALPKIVQNPLSSSTPTQPVDTSEVQIGFEWALNYPFVVSHPLSTTQIFTYLPIGIADGLGLKPEQIVVKNLLPLDTTAELQFITTVARVFIPSSMVDTLRVDLGIAASQIYQNPDESVNTLMNYINPAIPFFPGAVLDPGSLQTGTNSQVTHTPVPGDTGVFNTGTQQSQTASAKGTTAGIALAACGGAAAYGAAMFLLARRYKHRHQRRKQANLIRDSPDPSEDGEREASPAPCNDSGPLMSGGRMTPALDRLSRGSGRTGQSTRNATISAPMMAENSLGWN